MGAKIQTIFETAKQNAKNIFLSIDIYAFHGL